AWPAGSSPSPFPPFVAPWTPRPLAPSFPSSAWERGARRGTRRSRRRFLLCPAREQRLDRLALAVLGCVERPLLDLERGPRRNAQRREDGRVQVADGDRVLGHHQRPLGGR